MLAASPTVQMSHGGERLDPSGRIWALIGVMSLRNWLTRLAIAVALLVAAAPASAQSAPKAVGTATPPTGAELALQGRLMAPCCWTQTLDVHESEISTQLRAEIHTRLGRGESAEAIEDDFASRFGEQIRAMPKGRDPLRRVPALVGGAMLLSAVGLFWVLRRWARRGDEGAPSVVEPAEAAGDDYDARLDDELRRLDG